MKPTVGRIVHFYTTDPNKQSNGQGEGPYPAIVTQVWSDARYINLKVLGYDIVRDEGSVDEKDPDPDGVQARWWVWPPRE